MPSHIYPLIHTQITSHQHAPQPMPNTQYGINTNYDHPPTGEINMTSFDNAPPVPNNSFDSNFHHLGSHPYTGSQFLETHPVPNTNIHPWQVKSTQEQSHLIEPLSFPNRNNHPWQVEGTQEKSHLTIIKKEGYYLQFDPREGHPWQIKPPQKESHMSQPHPSQVNLMPAGSEFLTPHPFPINNPPWNVNLTQEGSRSFEPHPFPSIPPTHETVSSYNINPWGEMLSNFNNLLLADTKADFDKLDNPTEDLEKAYASMLTTSYVNAQGCVDSDNRERTECSTLVTGSNTARRLEFEQFGQNVFIDTGHPQAPHPFSRFFGHGEHSDTGQSDLKKNIYDEEDDQQENSTINRSPIGDQMPPHPFEQNTNYYSRNNTDDTEYTTSESEHFNRQSKSPCSVYPVVPDSLDTIRRREMQNAPHPFALIHYPKGGKHSRDYYSSYKHKDATEQKYVKEDHLLDEAAAWGEAPDTNQSDFNKRIYYEKEDQQESSTTDKSPIVDKMPPHPIAQNKNYHSTKHESTGRIHTDDTETSESEHHSRHSKGGKRSRDYYSSYSKHKDATQQKYVKEEHLLDEAAAWGGALENRNNDRRSNREGRRQTSDHERFYYPGSRSRIPPRSNRNYRSYETKPHDDDFRSMYENRSRNFGLKHSTRHENPTHSLWSDGEQSKTLLLQQNARGYQRGQAKSASFRQRPFEHQRHPEQSARGRGTSRIDHKSTQKMFHRKPQEDDVPATSSSVINEGLKHGSNWNEESGESGSSQVPKPHSSKINKKCTKNSSSPSKQSHKDTSPELELSVMDKLVNEELLKKAALMSMEQSVSSSSGNLKKGKKDKQKDLPDKNEDDQTSETKEDSSGTKDKCKEKVQQEEVDTEPEPKIQLNKSSEEETVWTGGVKLWPEVKYQMAEGPKFIDPRMEREKLNRSDNNVVAQMGDSINFGMIRGPEGSSPAT